jgi:hypothetical protein
MKEADGKPKHIRLILTSEDVEDRTPSFKGISGVVRVLNCFIPDAPQAIKTLEQEMYKFSSQTWVSDLGTKNNLDSGQNNDTTISGWVEECSYIPTGTIITLNPGTANETTIVFFRKTCDLVFKYPGSGGGGDFGGGGGGDGGGGDGGGDDGDACEPCEPDMPCENAGGNLGCSAGGGIGGFEEEKAKIIIDDSFKDTKAECVYDKLLNTGAGFNNYVQNFDEEFPVSHLKWTMDDLGATDTGETRPPIDLGNGSISPDYVITIAINNNTTSNAGVNYRPNLMVAKTLAHEVIHAEMFRKIMSLTQEQNSDSFTRQEIINLLSNGDYPGIYDYYRRYETNMDHQQMARHYRETIADMLQDFDNHSRSYSFYKDLAWEGLMTNDEYTNVAWEAESDTEQERIEDVILDYIDDNKSEGCQE